MSDRASACDESMLILLTTFVDVINEDLLRRVGRSIYIYYDTGIMNYSAWPRSVVFLFCLLR